eukprot:TRINITY_DN20425_c1_g1_i1.p2 TRINITY_DN20425_c1_g1~~TRINITY_DN20425_c1_g1_i1.p2  ORF type:complete len:526 (+),score=213.34 TRINITY_DN20425_c1_g1_i1:84-1580(+)
MRLLLPALHAAACAAAGCPTVPPPAPPAKVMQDQGVAAAVEEVKQMLQNATRANNISGMVVSIVYDQQTVWSGGFGLRDPAKPAGGPPAATDLVRIASVTKVFTTLLLYVLRDKGFVGLDDPVQKYIPEFSVHRYGATRGPITLRQLATHTSGLAREVPYPCSFAEYADGCSESRIVALLAQQSQVAPAGRRFHYSNLGIALLGRALQRAADPSGGTTYEQLVERHILRPLGMPHATFTWNATTQKHTATGTSPGGGAVPTHWTDAWDSPCGGLFASAADLAALMRFLFRDDAPADGGQQLLDGDSIREMLLPGVLLRDGGAVGSPWEMAMSGGVWIKGKQGELGGYRSAVALAEDYRLGIFVSALQTAVPEGTVWTVPAMGVLLPPLQKALERLAQPAAVPSPSLYVGSYCGGRAAVSLSPAGEMLLGGELIGAPLRLSAPPQLPVPHSLRTEETGELPSCRWLDDGHDSEVAYFNVTAGAPASSFSWMGMLCYRDR